MEIILATRNKKKAEEMTRILGGMGITILTLNDFPLCPEVEEDRDTFEGNAMKKALSAARHTGKIAIADDSGLEVYALHGAPGIISARYAGKDANDTANTDKLLNEMTNIADAERGARFVCCIAVSFPAAAPIDTSRDAAENRVVTFFGFVEGRIGKEPRGKMGFGYDPIFYPEEYNRSFAEIPSNEKDALSHRGRAIKKLKDCISSQAVPFYKGN